MSTPMFTFTSANTVILVNDKALGGVFKFEVRQYSKSIDAIVYLHRHIIGSDELINEMRNNAFTFKLLNNTSSSGYVSPAATVVGFEMDLSKQDDGKELLMTQKIAVNAPAFLYVTDARSENMKKTEEEDLQNLIGILKSHQAKSGEVGRAVLPTEDVEVKDEELVWLNAKDPEQLKDIKPRKIKKTKRA